MEVQMSPPLDINKDTTFEIRKSYPSQILYDALNLLQIVNLNEMIVDDDENFLLSDPRDISIPLSETNMINCHTKCKNNCANECNLCASCVGNSRIIHQIFREQMARRRFRRIFPKAKYLNKSDLIGKMHSSSKFILKWTYEKCRYDNEWC